MSKNMDMDMSARNHDRIVAAVCANLDDVYPTTNPTDGERDSWLDALLDEISECPYVDMLAENWEAIEDRLPDICPDLDDEEQEGWIRKAMADGTRKWLLDHAAEVVAHLAEENGGYLRRDLDALREVGADSDAATDAATETIGASGRLAGRHLRPGRGRGRGPVRGPERLPAGAGMSNHGL